MRGNGSDFGMQLRDWRCRRGLSQLDLARDAEISSRHLSFVETGRASPSRAMVVRLAEQLDIPLRERNTLLLATGYAPACRERACDDPALAQARDAVTSLLAAHEPYPALAVERHWTLVAGNRAVAPLLEGAAPALLAPPVNVFRLGLHPDGIAPRIASLPAWRAHLLRRLRRQAAHAGDPVLLDLLPELSAYPAPPADADDDDMGGVAVPLRIATRGGMLSLLSATMVFGTPTDVTLSELAVETFPPADPATAAAPRTLHAATLS